MRQKKTTITESIHLRIARLRRSSERYRLLRAIGGRGATALLFGTALSIGGIAETMDNTHFLILKDLDAVRVVRQNDEGQKVVASANGFAGNSLFKLARVLPDRYVDRELSLFDDRWMATSEWLSTPANAPDQPKQDVFYAEMRRVNDAIRAEFFADSVPYGALIHEKAAKYDVDPALVAAVIEQESRFRAGARSQVGARGLMQLMPRTGRWMGARDLYDPEQNVDAGVKYIRYLHQKYDGDLKKTLAAYNAGEGNVARYRGVPPFRETRQYVKKVLKNYDKRSRQLEKYKKEQFGGSLPEADGTLTLR